MKKISKLTALLAASALLFGGLFLSCSSDDDENNEATTETPAPVQDNPNVEPDPEEGDGTDTETNTDTDDKGGSVEQGTKATAKTYDFSVWSDADKTAFALEAYKDSKGTAKNTYSSPAGITNLSTGVSIYNKSASAIMIRTNSTDDMNTLVGLNYNGGITDSIANGIAVESLDRYICIPVDGAGTVTASVKIVNSSSKTGTLQVAFVDADGKLLGDLVTANVADGKIGTTDSNLGNITGSVTKAGNVYLAFSRNGAGGGGMDVYSIEVAPAE